MVLSNFKLLLAVAIPLLSVASCTSKKESEETTSSVSQPESQMKETDSWISLFDGTSAKGWRGFNEAQLPEGWVIENGTLKSLGKGGDIGGDIIYGDIEFEDFELYLEWKISKGGNSGIFYHVVEGDQYKAAYESAPEYQLIDDDNFPHKLEDWQQVGADYAMYPADPASKKTRPFGEWNTSRIIFTKSNVEYHLNGEKVVQFVPWSDDWIERRNSGKWENQPDYGKATKGYIGLQDHGDFIWFRNIKVKRL